MNDHHHRQHHHHQSQPSGSDNNSYRPQSPDLSAFAVPSHQQLQPHPHQPHGQSIFHPSYQEPSSASWQRQQQQQQQQQPPQNPTVLTGLPNHPVATHRGSYDASPYFSPLGKYPQAPGQGSYFFGGVPPTGSPVKAYPHQQTQGQLQPNISQDPAQPPLHVFPTASSVNSQQQQPKQSPSLLPQQQQQQHIMPPSRRKRSQPEDDNDSRDLNYAPDFSTKGEGLGARAGRKRKSNSSHGLMAGRGPDEVGPSQGIDIKTKFPVARIKRIIQADEDVGKVAQATPTAVSKALELFMINLVTKAAAEARDRSSKRVTAAHLKQAVMKNQTLDFLQEIIEKVPDPTEKGGGRAGSEDAADGSAAPPTKRKTASRGKKRSDSDED